MFQQKPSSQRKAASRFINDNNETNLIQLSPHRELEKRSPFTLSDNEDSKTNFIGDTILAPERPRAYVVTKTGEKHLLDLDNNALPKTRSNPFTLHSPRLSAPTMETISEKSSSHLSHSDKMIRSSSKLIKKLKPLKRQKHRLVFTPRNMETTSSTQLLAADNNVNKNILNQKQSMPVAKSWANTSIETQTENFPYIGPHSYIPRHFSTATGSINYIPMEGPKKYLNESVNTQRRFYSMATAQPPFKPLEIYTKYNPNLRKYSELRNIASAVTFITVVSWLFSKIFDIECFWDYLNSLWQHLCNWFSTKEKPKTKLEVLVTFFQDLWS
ncbi:uncharacterized protein LOC119609820 [Lucilia sericata]|uniref:uncharacterized protein LOC119609820 n=1 Tax=Lucilia sericata TaxID=13632 RepID=UPI0018A851F0|nr:uncharacterized protein LOC119609820 [Lucilia sericata]